MLANDLATYLQARQPAGIPFEDAVQVSMGLYSTVDGLPRSMRGGTSRDNLIDVFASLGASGWIGNAAPGADVSSAAFWGTVVSSVTAPTRWVLDVDRAEAAMIPFIGDS
jgi:hypothetical protein